MKIDIDQLMGAFEDHSEFTVWRFNVRTGEIGAPELDSLEEDEAEEMEESEDWVPVPTVESYEAYDWMVEFAETVEDPHLRDLLAVALDGPGAFRRFKDVLYGYPEEQKRWYEFHDSSLRQEILGWLESLGIRMDEPEGQG